jgi:hypothetical protein
MSKSASCAHSLLHHSICTSYHAQLDEQSDTTTAAEIYYVDGRYGTGAMV